MSREEKKYTQYNNADHRVVQIIFCTKYLFNSDTQSTKSEVIKWHLLILLLVLLLSFGLRTFIYFLYCFLSFTIFLSVFNSLLLSLSLYPIYQFHSFFSFSRLLVPSDSLIIHPNWVTASIQISCPYLLYYRAILYWMYFLLDLFLSILIIFSNISFFNTLKNI